MIDLHERLSEFSYGYGLTREAEELLRSIGLRPIPFLPSLVHEAEVAFDVGLADGGTVVMLQFKLGQEMKRFYGNPIPPLKRPFWRFGIDLQGHQFQLLATHEENGAEVYYAAPRFSTWQLFEQHYHSKEILENSLLVEPSWIAAQAIKGKHRIVYDLDSQHVCSDPKELPKTTAQEFVDRIEKKVRNKELTLSDQIERLASASSQLTASRLSRLRRASIVEKGKRPIDQLIAEIGMEAWVQGAQMLLVTDAIN